MANSTKEISKKFSEVYKLIREDYWMNEQKCLQHLMSIGYREKGAKDMYERIARVRYKVDSEKAWSRFSHVLPSDPLKIPFDWVLQVNNIGELFAHPDVDITNQRADQRPAWERIRIKRRTEWAKHLKELPAGRKRDMRIDFRSSDRTINFTPKDVPYWVRYDGYNYITECVLPSFPPEFQGGCKYICIKELERSETEEGYSVIHGLAIPYWYNNSENSPVYSRHHAVEMYWVLQADEMVADMSLKKAVAKMDKIVTKKVLWGLL